MLSDWEDPIKSGGDTRSWFFFYKWRAGVTSIKAIDVGPGAYNDTVQKGDHLVFCMDGAVIAVAKVLNVEYCVTWNANEVYFDSDTMLIPKNFENMGMLRYSAEDGDGRHMDLVMESAVPLSDIPEGEEPEWLKNNFLMKRPR
jgi:hypothetical protein